MRLINDGRQYVCESSYDERDIPKSAGCRWNPAGKYWYTTDILVARKLAEYADPDCAAHMDEHDRKQAQAIESSRATDTDRDLPVPAGLDYRPFQRAGIAYALDHKNCLIADEMGLGKTIQAIGLINAAENINEVLVICPASLKLNWQRECQKWLTQKLSVEIAGTDFPHANIVIINYDQIKKHIEAIRATAWDLLICDESHYLKNPKAQRTGLILGNKENPPIKAARKIFLTGTPILNRPIELHPMLRSLGAEFASNWVYYVKRYCAGEQTKYGWDVSGNSNTDELNTKLRASLMIRREKSQVLSELPDKIHQLIPINPNGNSAVVNREIAAWKNHEEKTAAIKKEIAALRAAGKNDTDEYRSAVTTLRSASLADFTEISRLRHETAVAKIPVVCENVIDAAESGSIVVFAHHTDVLDGIVAALKKEEISCAKIDGGTPIDERQKIVDDFQAGKIRVFVGSIRACGVGLTLTKSSHVIFAELDWTPATIAQAEDRCHRIGQKETVLVQHIVFDGSIDSMIAKKLVDKEEIIEEILA